VYERLGDTRETAITWGGIADLHQHHGDLRHADRHRHAVVVEPAAQPRPGGWQRAAAGVAYTATFTATTTTTAASFGIEISYTAAAGQPSVLPNSGPVTLTHGGIWVAQLGSEKFF
jgi:hypothetical protein